MRRKVEVLHRHCADVGRDPTEIEVTVLSTADAPTVEDHVGRYRAYAEVGVDTVIVNVPELTSAEPLRRFADVVAAFRT